jgi:toxin CcdB
MQHELFANPVPQMRAAYPYVVQLHADIASEGDPRVVAPMMPFQALPKAAGRLMPTVPHGERQYLVGLPLMFSVSRGALRNPVGSVAAYRDEITRALDWLFTGV